MLSSERVKNVNAHNQIQDNTLNKGFSLLRRIIILLGLIIFIGFWAYKIDITIPGTPSINNTYTPLTHHTGQEIGSYDVLGKVISKEEAASLLKTDEGKQLSADNGAVAVTEDLISLGRNAFYRETFGNEVFLTDVTGILNGPLNVANLTKAILALGGKHTTNLQVTMDRDMKVGSRTFKKGDILNTGLDVPANSIFPLGVITHINEGKIRVGITCASCHAAVDKNTGRILEGAPNNDLDTGLILALASNSAAWFRQTGVNPLTIRRGEHTYIKSDDKQARLPDVKALEEAVDEAFLTWAPGNFDSTGDNVNNPSQNPSSYTFAAYPYGWSGNAAIGWFHGLTTLNSKVHATNSDLTTGADASKQLLGIDKETYLGVILQNSANPAFKLRQLAKPSEFIQKIDITSEKDFTRAFAIGNAGGYKVPSLIGLNVTAPYLHDGGVAVGDQALLVEDNDLKIVNSKQLGMTGTLLNGVVPDPNASMRSLLDRNLRRLVVAANRKNSDLQKSNVDGSGHNYWVDKQAGFTTQDQTDLIEFLLSLDDEPEVVPVQSR